MREEGLARDVASGGELHLALAAGYDPARIYMHGNNKSQAELDDGGRRRASATSSSTRSTRSSGCAAPASACCCA